jgi:hypothetical protein
MMSVRVRLFVGSGTVRQTVRTYGDSFAKRDWVLNVMLMVLLGKICLNRTVRCVSLCLEAF